MDPYRVSVVHGWCGNRLGPLVEHLAKGLDQAGFPAQVTLHSIWEQRIPPRGADLVLQVLPVFAAAETGCPVLDIRNLLADFNHRETWERILACVRREYTARRNTGDGDGIEEGGLEAGMPKLAKKSRKRAADHPGQLTLF